MLSGSQSTITEKMAAAHFPGKALRPQIFKIFVIGTLANWHVLLGGGGGGGESGIYVQYDENNLTTLTLTSVVKQQTTL